MPLDISRHGDLLEQKYSDIIRQKIPAYEEIWKRYIGNDGKARLISMPGLTADQQMKRMLFSQYHYTAFESLVCMNELLEELSNTELATISNYLKTNNIFLAFQAHAGRIRDCVKKMGESFGLRKLHERLDNFYKQRSEVLHGCKIPFMIIDGFFAIPTIKGVAENEAKWNSGKAWDEVGEDDFRFLYDYLFASYGEIAKILNDCLHNIFDAIKRTISNRTGVLEPTASEDYNSLNNVAENTNHFYTLITFTTSGATASISSSFGLGGLNL